MVLVFLEVVGIDEDVVQISGCDVVCHGPEAREVAKAVEASCQGPRAHEVAKAVEAGSRRARW